MFAFNFCKICSTILEKTGYCPTCKKYFLKQEVEKLELKQESKKRTIQKTIEKKEDPKIGPLVCEKCKKKTFYFIMAPPKSPDQPNVFISTCLNKDCSYGTQTQYKD